MKNFSDTGTLKSGLMKARHAKLKSSMYQIKDMPKSKIIYYDCTEIHNVKMKNNL